MTAYYHDDTVTLYHGDALEVLPTISACDLVVTSPPYNRGARIDADWQGSTTATCKGRRFRGGYGEHDDAMEWGAYREWLRQAVGSTWARVADRGAMFLNLKPRVVNGRLWMPTEAAADLPLRQIVVWETGPGINFTPGAFVPSHEWVMLIARDGFALRDSRSAAIGDVWRIRPTTDPDHPAPFPLALATRCIASTRAKSVLDPFAGTGTTLVAAKSLGVAAVGIEREERYCELVARRCAQETLFANAG